GPARLPEPAARPRRVPGRRGGPRPGRNAVRLPAQALRLLGHGARPGRRRLLSRAPVGGRGGRVAAALVRYYRSMSDDPANAPTPGSPELNVKITDEELKGRYSNLLRVTHTRDEFILDF